MAKIAKFYPVLPYERKSRDVLLGGKRAAKSDKRSYGNYHYWYQTLVNGTALPALGWEARGSFQNGSDSASYINNPGWRVIIAKGGDASAAYTRTVWRIGSTGYSVQSRSNVGSTYVSNGRGSIFGANLPSTPPAGLEARLQSQALASVKRKLQGYIGNAQLAAPIAESREIHRLVRQINSLGMDTLKAVLAIKKTKGKSASKLFGQVWLGFGFGVNPMLKDIQNAADSILKYTTRQDQNVRVMGTASGDWISAQSNVIGIVAYGTNMHMHHAARHKLSVRYLVGADLQTRSAASYSVGDHLGLKIESVPSTLWELTPFSWMFDYFITVGPWLEDMFYVLPGVCKYVNKTTKYQVETTSRPSYSTIIGFNLNCSGGGGAAISRYINFSRTVLASLPTQQLRIKSADELASHGITKLLNLASVIAGRRGPNL